MLIKEVLRKYRNGENLRVWHICSYKRYVQFEKQGVMKADGRRILWRNEFREPYRWMMNQMKKRLPAYSGKYPIWLWVYPACDLRRKRYQCEKGKKFVRLECEISSYRILLSGFDLWHMVLNRVPVCYTKKEWNDLYRISDRTDGRFPKEVWETVCRSWERIFDIEDYFQKADPDWNGLIENEKIQGVVEELSIDDVVRITPFTGAEHRH